MVFTPRPVHVMGIGDFVLQPVSSTHGDYSFLPSFLPSFLLLQFVDSQNKELAELQMLKRYMIWASKMDFGVTQRCASSSKMHATLSASSGSRLSWISPSLSPASSTACHVSGPTEESVTFSTCVELPPPGTDAVVARQPLTRVDLLVARLPGGTAIRGWCSRVIRVCISRARFWT